MTAPDPAPRGDVVEVVLALSRTARGRTVVDVRSTGPELHYGTVELGELPLLLEALMSDALRPGGGLP